MNLLLPEMSSTGVCWKPCCPAGGAVLEDSGSLKRWSLPGGSDHWGGALRLYGLVPFSVRAQLPECECNVTSQAPDMMPHLPYPPW